MCEFFCRELAEERAAREIRATIYVALERKKRDCALARLTARFEAEAAGAVVYYLHTI